MLFTAALILPASRGAAPLLHIPAGGLSREYAANRTFPLVKSVPFEYKDATLESRILFTQAGWMMHQEPSTPSLRTLAIYSIGAVVIATAFSFAQFVRAADQPIDLDKNAANGAESKVSTKVLQTYPVKIENTIYNNAAGTAFNFKWPGAGPGGFTSFVTAGPGVGTKWVWSTVYQVYSIDSPMAFTPARTLSVLGTPPRGVGTVGAGSGGSFMVAGKSIYPSQVTLSDVSLSASLITFFSPEKTVATCGFQCAPGECEIFLENRTGGTVTISAKQLGCCPEPHQLICDGQCESYLSDTGNCGECGNVCASDEICSDGACVCPSGLDQCGAGCIDLSTSAADCGACGNVCASDEFCGGGACVCNPGLAQCGSGCIDPQTDPANCGTCGNVCAANQFCGGGACVCNPGLAQCGAGCVNLQTDPANCGTCGTVCAPGGSCSNGGCVCPAGQTQCGQVCLDLQTDRLNCGACGNVCEANDICTGGTCVGCRAPRATECNNQCVNIHTDPNNCGACGYVCNFSGCPSAGQGTCSQGSSCVCSPSPKSSTSSIRRPFKPELRETPAKPAVRVSRRARKAKTAAGQSRPASVTQTPIMTNAVKTKTPGQMSVVANTEKTKPASHAAAMTKSVSTQSTDQMRTVTRAVAVLNPNEAPVCDLAPIEQVIPGGGTYTQMQTGGRFGKEIQTSVSIAVDGKTIAQGPCPQVVPVVGVDTSGVILSPIAVATRDTSGDGLCQPGESRCDYFITMADLGDSSCVSPVATLSSPPDQFNLNQITLLNASSAYPTLPAYPGDGVPLDKKTNTTAFSISTQSNQASDVGRAFMMSVACANQPAPVLMPITLGIGSVCDPNNIDGKAYDHLNGFQSPVSAALVPQGSPVNYSSRTFNHGSSIPLKLTLACGSMVLNDAGINPNPQIVAVVHETLGPQSLVSINGDNNANPDDPGFSCSTTGCDFQFRTEGLPVGRTIISVQMPDTRIFQAGFTINP